MVIRLTLNVSNWVPHIRSKYPYVHHQSWAFALAQMLSIELDSYLQHKTTMSSSSKSKAMHGIELEELCLMYDHAFCKFSFINSLIKTFFQKTFIHKTFFHKAFFLKTCFHKTLFLKACFGPLVLVHIVRFCHNTMPARLSMLKISHGLSCG